MIIYKITNIINNKVYIGLTKGSLESRWNRHVNSSVNGSNFTIHNAIRKYGSKNFKIETIEKCNSISSLKKSEIKWIKELNSLNGGYNMTSGGEGTFGFKHSEETKRKISEMQKGKKASETTKIKLSKIQKEKWKDVEYISKMSSIQKEIHKRPGFIDKKSKISKNYWNRPGYKENQIKKAKIAANKSETINKQEKIRTKRWVEQLKNKHFNVYKAIKVGVGLYKKGAFVGSWNKQKDCANTLDICSKGISTALTGKRSQSKGYIFEHCKEEAK